MLYDTISKCEFTTPFSIENDIKVSKNDVSLIPLSRMKSGDKIWDGLLI